MMTIFPPFPINVTNVSNCENSRILSIFTNFKKHNYRLPNLHKYSRNSQDIFMIIDSIQIIIEWSTNAELELEIYRNFYKKYLFTLIY